VDDEDVNPMLAQLFVNYNIKDGWYISTAPIMTANWEADSGQKWTVPVGAGRRQAFAAGLLQRGEASVWTLLAASLPGAVPAPELLESQP